ncbi:glycosyltransferase [Belliella sp. DSM 111904]|uniref:Glycosyltransferase n=1 Tax=Belliella filtrata TaxID=2923435 RepID=A0ABS9V4B7_9BACT|nr:glycosyltransferase [Belliella filtrata]MCH7410830.1 glycosyltransferase [Belliella filtrata]
MKQSTKILILNQPFDNNTGGGITLSNLFEGIDSDKVAVVCSAQLINSNTNFEKCRHYYQLGVIEQKWLFPFSLLRSNNHSGSVRKSFPNPESLAEIPQKPTLKSTLVNKVFFPFIGYSGIYHSIFSLKLSPKLISWIKDFDPDIIYAQAQSLQEVRFCQEIKDKFGLPFIFHMMDDWISLPGQSFISKLIWKKKIALEFEKLLKASDKVFTISDYMSKEYLRRYGIKSDVFHNPVDDDFWGQHQKQLMALNDSPTILYAGRVGLSIDESLIMMANAVNRLNQIYKTQVKFVIQTEKKPNWVDKYNYVYHKRQVPYVDLPAAFSSADILFLPYDFSKKSIDFIKYSMPTKASEYMISGTPILILAPKDTAIVDDALNLGWAQVLTEERLEKLVDMIATLLFNKELRTQITDNAKRLAKQVHSKRIVQERFFKNLHESAGAKV